METKESQTVFIGENAFEEGLDIITVMQKVNGNNIFIGSIYREHHKGKIPITYTAVDFEYNQIFNRTKKIEILKQKFIKHGKTLAMLAPEKQNKGYMIIDEKKQERAERMHQLINAREKKSNKERTEGKEEDIER